MTEQPYNDYKSYLENIFGEPVHKVSVRGGFTCPNIDGTVAKGGCTYCNNASFVPSYIKRVMSIREQIEKGIKFLSERYGAQKFLAYFQSYSNTYDEPERLAELYQEALSHDQIVGLVVGTRADCVPDPTLDLLEALAKDYYVSVEYGIESISDETLRRINRGHDHATLVDAIKRSQGRGFHIGSHLIFGFPWEDRTHWLRTAEVVSEIGVEYTKIHHLHVVKGTAMAEQFARESFHVFEFDEWVQLVVDFIERLSPEIVVGRMAGGAPPNLLIAPKWNGKRHTHVVQAVRREFKKRGTHQGYRWKTKQVA